RSSLAIAAMPTSTCHAPATVIIRAAKIVPPTAHALRFMSPPGNIRATHIITPCGGTRWEMWNSHSRGASRPHNRLGRPPKPPGFAEGHETGRPPTGLGADHERTGTGGHGARRIPVR